MKKSLFFFSCFFQLNIILFAHCSVRIDSPDLILCPNEKDTLWVEVYDSIQWYTSGNMIPGETKQYLVVDASTYDGHYLWAKVSDHGCTSSSNSVYVEEKIISKVTITATDSSSYLEASKTHSPCQGDTITFHIKAPIVDSIKWYADSQIMSLETDSFIKISSPFPQNAIAYSVCAWPNECPNYMECLEKPVLVEFINCDNASMTNVKIAFDVYPNPTKGILNIISYGQEVHQLYRVYDQLGNIWIQGTIKTEHEQLDISHLPPNLYLLKVDNYSFNIVKINTH